MLIRQSLFAALSLSALAAPALLSLPVTEAMSAPSTVISIGRGLDSYQAHTQAQMDVL